MDPVGVIRPCLNLKRLNLGQISTNNTSITSHREPTLLSIYPSLASSCGEQKGSSLKQAPSLPSDPLFGPLSLVPREGGQVAWYSSPAYQVVVKSRGPGNAAVSM